MSSVLMRNVRPHFLTCPAKVSTPSAGALMIGGQRDDPRNEIRFYRLPKDVIDFHNSC